MNDSFSELEKELQKIGTLILKLLTKKGLTENDFNRKILYKHFEKIANGTFDGL